MAASMGPYETWLTEKLLSLNPETDTDVFVTYITGILEEETTDDEKRESVIDLLAQIVEEEMEKVCDELFVKWNEISGVQAQTNSNNSNSSRGDHLTDHLASILEGQKIEPVKAVTKSAEEIAIKEAILAQYSHISSGEESDEEEVAEGATAAATTTTNDRIEDLLNFKNDNADLVKKMEHEQKEKSRQEAEKKREKDKLDREAQKQKEKERKETEKKRTQKGERKR